MNTVVIQDSYSWWHNQEPVIFFSVLLLVLVVHFLPTLIAYSRNQSQRLLIFLLNLFLGWTGIMWIILMVWASIGERDTIST